MNLPPIHKMENTGIRTKYITTSERSLLLSLIEERKSILFDKSHDHRVIHKKNVAWAEVTEAFNARGYGPQRSLQQVKKIWENTKRKAKKDYFTLKKESVQTGGGAPLRVEDEEMAKVISIISDEIDDLGNDVDIGVTRTIRDVPVFNYDSDGELEEHTYVLPESSVSLVVTDTTETTQHSPPPPPSQHTTILTPLDYTIVSGSSSSSPKPESTEMSNQRKRRRSTEFTQEAATSEASFEMQKREHELKMKSLELSIELKKEALRTVQKFSAVADLLMEKFK